MRLLLRGQDYLIRNRVRKIIPKNLKASKMQFKIAIIMVLMQIAAGDLIGWNRTRNTAHKHMLVRNKFGNTGLIDQYRQFYKIQKLRSAVVKNIKKRSADQLEDEPANTAEQKQQQKVKTGRSNRFRNFRKFHA